MLLIGSDTASPSMSPFILSPIFDQTKELFRKWLLYGIGTLFSMAMLSFISSLVLQLTLRVDAALWCAGIINTITSQNAEGFSSQALQQGGLGLLMTTLIISAPPMAATFSQGTIGNFLTCSAFGMGNASRLGPRGQSPGSYGSGYGGGVYAPHVSGKAQTADSGRHAGHTVFSNNLGATTRLTGTSTSTYADAIRPAPMPPWEVHDENLSASVVWIAALARQHGSCRGQLPARLLPDRCSTRSNGPAKLRPHSGIWQRSTTATLPAIASATMG